MKKVDIFEQVSKNRAEAKGLATNTPEMQLERHRVREATGKLLAQGQVVTGEEGHPELDYTIIAAQWQGLALGLVDATPPHQLILILHDLPKMFGDFLSAILIEARRADFHENDRGFRPLQSTEEAEPAAKQGNPDPWLAPMMRMQEGLAKCRDQFQFYADEHQKAGKAEKAATNQAYADLATAAALEFQPFAPTDDGGSA